MVSLMFSMDMEGEVQQHTNVVGSVYGVDITQEGHILYTDFTGHGFRIKMLGYKRKNDIVDYPGILLGEDVEPSVRENTQKITEEPPEPSIVEYSRSYESANGHHPFSLMPVVRTTDKNVEVGNYFFLGDVIEEHYLEAMANSWKGQLFIFQLLE